MENEHNNDIILQACLRCGALLECGITNGRDVCWCMKPPNVLTVPKERNDKLCYCESCLELKIREGSEDN